MKITDRAEASAYFERLVERHMRCFGKSREEAERIERTNLGYYAGYGSHETRERVEDLFDCQHPVFGSAANGPPTVDEAVAAGRQMAED
ncbi:MAG: hypothetical protein AAF532_17450 [Planctomycetota bacterium]